jgi:endonuclease YncB( thermonuclease family)
MKRVIISAVLAVLVTTPLIAGEQIVDVASVIDGDTIDIHGQRIRLHGIDAPESGQNCSRDGAEFLCGKTAAFALSDKIGRQVVNCEKRDTDRYQRVVAICTLNGVDLNRWLVQQGHAMAYRKYSTDYVVDEESAKSARAGIWAGEFVNPAEFRKARRMDKY